MELRNTTCKSQCEILGGNSNSERVAVLAVLRSTLSTGAAMSHEKEPALPSHCTGWSAIIILNKPVIITKYNHWFTNINIISPSTKVFFMYLQWLKSAKSNRVDSACSFAGFLRVNACRKGLGSACFGRNNDQPRGLLRWFKRTEISRIYVLLIQ